MTSPTNDQLERVPVELYSDQLFKQAPYIEHGVLLEYAPDKEIAVYSERLDDAGVVRLLARALRALQG